MKPKHQYFILPYNIYRKGNEYYLFNTRQIIMSTFDIKKIQTIKMTYLKGFLVSVGFSGLLVFVLFIYGPIKAWVKSSLGGEDKEKGKQIKK